MMNEVYKSVKYRTMVLLMRVLLLLVVICFPGWATAAGSDSDMPVNPNIADRREYIADPASLMSKEAKQSINQQLDELRKTTTCEVGVVVIPTTGDRTIEEFTGETFEKWGLGKKDKDNGLLLVIAVNDRMARIQTGYGLEGVLPDIVCRNIIRRDIAPAMTSGSLDAAVGQALVTVDRMLTDPEYADEVRSELKENNGMQSLSPDVLWSFMRIMMFCVFVFSLGAFCYDLRRGRTLNNYGKALLWRSHLTTYLVASFLSLGLSLIFYLLALWLSKRYRNKPVKCEVCGAKMRKLDETTDNLYLTPGQDMEENLRTVDYDVWLCPDCGATQCYPFREKNAKYRECPNCHTIAMTDRYTRTVVPATTRHAGRGVKVSECLFCNHKEEEPFVIPKKPDPTAAVVAGSVLGSMSGRSGGGFGGGFGGGSSGGGGASGGW